MKPAHSPALPLLTSYPGYGVEITPSDYTTYDPPIHVHVMSIADGAQLVFEDVAGAEHTRTVAAGMDLRCLVTKVKVATTASCFGASHLPQYTNGLSRGLANFWGAG
jgi:hypothetical protein